MWPRQNGRLFAYDNSKCIFLWANIRISIKISLKLHPQVAIDSSAALVQIMTWRRPDDMPLFEAMLVSLLTHIYKYTSLDPNALIANCWPLTMVIWIINLSMFLCILQQMSKWYLGQMRLHILVKLQQFWYCLLFLKPAWMLWYYLTWNSKLIL